MSTQPRSKPSSVQVLLTLASIAAITVASGCGIGVQGNAIPAMPGLGCYDLDPTEVTVEASGAFPGFLAGFILDSEAFVIRWGVCYENGAHQDPLSSGEYITRVQIFSVNEDGTLEERIFDEEIVSPSLDPGDCREETVAVEDGLPPGEYHVYVRVDNDDTVHECGGLPYSYANMIDVALTVVEDPSGGLSSPASDSNDDDQGTPQQLQVNSSATQ